MNSELKPIMVLTAIILVSFGYILYHRLYEHEVMMLEENKTFTENIRLKAEIKQFEDSLAKSQSITDTIYVQTNNTNRGLMDKGRTVKNLPADSTVRELTNTIRRFDSIIRLYEKDSNRYRISRDNKPVLLHIPY